MAHRRLKEAFVFLSTLVLSSCDVRDSAPAGVGSLRSHRPLNPRGTFPEKEEPYENSLASPSKIHDTSSEDRSLSSPFPQRHEDDEGEVCIAVTGGAGQIAYALLPSLIDGRVFGDGRRVRLRLLDIEPCAEALEGVAMEIRDCCSRLVTEVVTTTIPEVAFKDADVAILLGGFPRLPGMERRDLIAKNVHIMADHGRALAKCAKTSVRVLVVANPACTNCLVASICAPSIPRSQFSSLARLDQDRLSAMLAAEISSGTKPTLADVEPRPSGEQEPLTERRQRKNNMPPSHVDIRGVYLWGNHSPSMWPDVSRGEAKMNGRWVPVEDFLGGEEARAAAEGSGDKVIDAAAAEDRTAARREWVSTMLVPAVRARGTKVMEARGKSSALSAANAIAGHLRDWLSTPTVDKTLGDAQEQEGVAVGRNDGYDRLGRSSERGKDSGSVRSEGDARGAAATSLGGGTGGRGERRTRRYRERSDRGGRRFAVAAYGSMGVSSDGNPYGVPGGLFYSFPVACGEGRHRIMEGFSPDKAMLDASTQELLEERQEAFDMLRESGLLEEPPK